MSGGGGDDEATAFDLTALMDVLSNIIFFLMASFGAAVVAILPASVPTLSEGGENDTAREDDKVTLTMRLKKDGTVEVSASNNDMLPEELKPYEGRFPSKDGALDEQRVSDHLWGIKEKFRKSKDLMLIPDDDVTYELIINAMDVARERKQMVGGKPVFPEMFPAVIVSSMAK
jgi:biopolymer transport protein ExbD